MAKSANLLSETCSNEEAFLGLANLVALEGRI
jgi:hypothetical protein